MWKDYEELSEKYNKLEKYQLSIESFNKAQNLRKEGENRFHQKYIVISEERQNIFANSYYNLGKELLDNGNLTKTLENFKIAISYDKYNLIFFSKIQDAIYKIIEPKFSSNVQYNYEENKLANYLEKILKCF